MSKSKDSRRLFILDARKGKFPDLNFHAIIKYHFNADERAYILERLGKKYYNIAYCTPKPESHGEIRKYPSFLESGRSLVFELLYYLEPLKKHVTDINNYLEINADFERLLLLSDYDHCLDLLDKMDADCGHSLYSMLAEYYVNEVSGNSAANQELLRRLTDDKVNVKLLIIMNLSRHRIDKAVSSLGYEGAIEQHKKLYDKTASAHYLDYLSVRFDHLDFPELEHYAFILNFDSDLSLIDRYQSLKKVLPLILNDERIPQSEKIEFINACHEFSLLVKDNYWLNFQVLFTGGNGPFTDRSDFHLIQDFLFDAQYGKVVLKCSKILKVNPHFSELYVPFVQALIQVGESVERYFDSNHALFDILDPMKAVLEKRDSYSADKERLLKKFYAISHLDFSFHILEFVSNELNISVNQPIQLISFLNSSTLRYNAFKLFKTEGRLIEVLRLNPYKTESYLLSLLEGKKKKSMFQSYLALKVDVGFLIRNESFVKALDQLLVIFKDRFAFERLSTFMQTWVRRNLIRCLVKLERFGEASDVVVDSFFERNFAYEHYIDEKLFEQLSDPFEDSFSDFISIPIMFEIYHVDSNRIYDVVANFLIAKNVKVPSELLQTGIDKNDVAFNYFLEKCCVKENLEDSPFLGSLAALDEERIKILNYLKQVNPTKNELFNREIRGITQETSIRQGLLQIHESRIYIDDQNILKVYNTQLHELFDSYIALTNVKLNPAVMLLDQNFTQPNGEQVAYYFKEPVSDEALLEYDYLHDYSWDGNVVEVPELRYQYFVAIFNLLKELFVNDEDYGFKSFLSMRIRHGTFTNVLRMVFEKHNLISSKDSNSDLYQDIRTWSELISSSKEKSDELQILLKEFSTQIDLNIEKGLSWLVIRGKGDENSTGYFDFDFSQEEIYALFRNRIGRIDDFKVLQETILQVVFERLEKCLALLRQDISTVFVNSFVSLMDELQGRVEVLKLKPGENAALTQTIVDCRTEIQSIISQIENWFRISKNKYIEEFPINLILETIYKYINSIYANALDIAILHTDVKGGHNIKGKYFEAFGDIFSNIFDNIVGKNKELKEHLRVNVEIEELHGQLRIQISNNLAENIVISDLLDEIEKAKIKIKNYQNGSDVSYERGSGYVKLCKSIAVDLQRKNYTILPEYEDGCFIVTISFETENLFS